MTLVQSRRSWVVGVAVALVCAGCTHAGASVGSDTSSPPSPGASAAASGSDHSAHTAATVGDVRLRFEQLLGHHSILMVRLMRGPIDKSEAFTNAAQGALDKNTSQLADMVAAAYGNTAGAQFRSLWNQHIAALLEYSRAVASDDASAKQRAKSTLDGYAAKYGDFVEEVTHGRLSSEAATRSVEEHIGHLTHAIDAYKAGNYRQAFAMERVAYGAMFANAKALAGASVRGPRGELPVAFNSPTENLKSGLGQLLGEHAELVFDVTRAIVSGHAAADAAAKALNENTSDVLAAMNGAVGADAASAFGAIWAAHIDALVAFSVDVADDDAAAQAKARARLDRFPGRLGALLAPLSHGTVSVSTVVAALRQHDQQLLQQVTAYAAKDFKTSQDIASMGYDHMFAIADTLAEVLSGRSAATAPRGGAATGGGGLARP